MKLRTRLSLAVTAVTAAALLASFASVDVIVKGDEMRDLDLSIVIQARAAAQVAAATDPMNPRVEDGSAEVPESIDPTTRYMAVYGPDRAHATATRSFGGEVPPFDALGVAPQIPPEGAAVNLTVAGAPLRGAVVPIGSRGHVLLYAVSRRSVDEDARFLNQLLIGIFVVATVLTSLVARWLGGRLAGDVDAIATVARSVTEGNLGARVGGGARRSAETKALAADLDRMIERLSALVASQRTFISHAAHELRSPLATLRGELQLALRRPREAAEYRHTIEGVLDDVEALTRLAEDLLTLARLEANAPTDQTVPIGEAVHDALRMARGLADARGVALLDASDPGGAASWPRVAGSRGEIARVLRNLVDNAVAHSPEGGTVTVAIALGEGSARVAVSDEGPGVSATDEPHIFAAFFRGAKDQGSEEVGAGLGLSIARGIARRHGGDVFLDRATAGACFVLELPLGSAPPASASPRRAQGDTQAASS